MEYFQIRKNSRQVLRIDRGPYEGLDITRIQIWYKEPKSNEYKPGRTIAFASDLIPGVVEGLAKMCTKQPNINIGALDITELSVSLIDIVPSIKRILKAHKRPLHCENISVILHEEEPNLPASNCAVYNALLGNPGTFNQVEEDVFTLC